MMRFFFAAIALIAMVNSIFAQSFSGYGPSGQIPIGQGNTAPPLWAPLAGDCTLVAAGTITCTKTNSVTLGTMATQDANAVAITGGMITGLPAPSGTADAATKGYVDAVAAGLIVHQAARLGTATALPANTYNNGTAGVGATLTANGNGALTVDGIAVTVSDRIVVKNEAAPANNGIYSVTQVGDGSNPYILTRTTDANIANTGDPNKIGSGSYVFVLAGAANTNTGWLVNSTVVTIGTDPINWVQFSAGASVASLNGLTGVLSIPQATSATGSVVSLPIPMPAGRLTLQANTPVMTTTQSNIATLRYDCYHGNVVPYYNGTTVLVDTIANCEVTDAMQSSSTGVLNNAGVFDVWWEGNTHHNICVATNGSGGGWASDTGGGSNTVRGTGYSQLTAPSASIPFYTNTNSITHCYNGATDYGAIAANRATYLGTFFTTAAGQTSYIFGTTNGTIARFLLWNAYNQVDVSGSVWTSVSSYAFGVLSWREAAVHAHVDYVDGLGKNVVKGYGQEVIQTTATSSPLCDVAMNVDITTAQNTTNAALGTAQATTDSFFSTVTATYRGFPGVGKHTVYMLEQNGSGSGACSVLGASGGGVFVDLKM